MPQSMQIYYVPYSTDPDDCSYSVVTVIDGIITNSTYHEESIEDGLHFENTSEYDGMEYEDSPYPRYPFVEKWFDSEEEFNGKS